MALSLEAADPKGNYLSPNKSEAVPGHDHFAAPDF